MAVLCIAFQQAGHVDWLGLRRSGSRRRRGTSSSRRMLAVPNQVGSHALLIGMELSFAKGDFVVAAISQSDMSVKIWHLDEAIDRSGAHWKTNLWPLAGLEFFVTEAVHRAQGAMI